MQDMVMIVVNTEGEDGSDRMMPAISETVELLRIVKTECDRCKFFLDTHGGKRDDQENVNAVLNLLRIEQIYFEDIYNI